MTQLRKQESKCFYLSEEHLHGLRILLASSTLATHELHPKELHNFSQMCIIRINLCISHAAHALLLPHTQFLTKHQTPSVIPTPSPWKS